MRKAPLPEDLSTSPDVVESPPPPPTLGDEILGNYANPNSDIRQDLELFQNYLRNVFLLIKKRDTRYYSSNEELAEFLLGKNPHRTPYLSTQSRILNQERQLIDRWDTPLKIHPLSGKVLEIRSAGPDTRYYTEDDFVIK